MSLAWDQSQLAPDMDVVSSTGEPIGRVKEVRIHDFLVDRTMKRDIYVPFSAVQDISGQTVTLQYRADEIQDLDWDKAPLLGRPDTADSVAPQADLVTGRGDPDERNGWSPASDSYTLGPIDTTDARLATEGIDDGKPPRPKQPAPSVDALDDTERVREELA
jgi:hypothetical protein